MKNKGISLCPKNLSKHLHCLWIPETINVEFIIIEKGFDQKLLAVLVEGDLLAGFFIRKEAQFAIGKFAEQEGNRV